MTSKRPDGRPAFLGTDDIVRRLRDAQPPRFGTFGLIARNLALLAGVGVVLGAGWRAVNFWRADRAASGLAVVRVAPGPAEQQPGVTPQVASSMAAPASGGRAAAGERTSGPKDATTRVEVRVLGLSSGVSVYVDGRWVASTNHWSGDLSRGRHQLEVRHKFGEQTHELHLAGQGQEVTFDPHGRHVRSRGLHGSNDQGK